MTTAMEDTEKVSSAPLTNYHIILEEIKELTARIHREVNQVLADYKRDTAEYYRRMGNTRRITTTTSPTTNPISPALAQKNTQIDYQSIPGAYESSCVKIRLSERVNRELRSVVCHGGNNPKGTILVKQKLKNYGLFFHDQKAKQYHISVAFMEANHNKAKEMEDYYQYSLNLFASTVASNLQSSYSGHVNHGTVGLNGVWMFVNGYDQNQNKITKHYPNYQKAHSNIVRDFTFSDSEGRTLCSAVSCHYVLRTGTSQTCQCDGKAGPLTNDINALTQEINTRQDQGWWTNPYRGSHDAFLGHITVGVVKRESGKINMTSQRFQPTHLKLLLEGYEEIQSCFDWKNSNGDIKAQNERIKQQNQKAKEQYNSACQSAFDKKYQRKVQEIKNRNKTPDIADAKIARINQQAIWKEVWGETSKPQEKPLFDKRVPVDVFKDLPIENYVMETTLVNGEKEEKTLQGTKR